MEITINNCNNIDSGKITIKEDTLNIKYAINGTGKTSISLALEFYINDKKYNSNTLLDLKPFKNIEKDDGNPEILGVDQINKIKIFDEKYLDEFIFLPSELIKGSFDIFIRDENYEKGLQEINDQIDVIKQLLSEDREIDEIIKDFSELSSCFGQQTKNGIHGASPISKAFKNGNKVANIPEGLEDYREFIQDRNNVKWIKWQLDGKIFLDISDNCPYCTINFVDKKTKINRIHEEYDSKTIENLNRIISVFQRLNQYFSEDTKGVIENIVTNIDGFSQDQVSYLIQVKEQIDSLYDKFINVKNLGFNSFKNVDKVIEGLKSLLIDIQYYPYLSSEETKKKVNLINQSINKLLTKAGELQGSISKQKIIIENLVREYKNEINGFLRNAGYQYHVDLRELENGEINLILLHNDLDNEIKNVKNHLSYGERNAFALILFMFDAIKYSPDLIILDDPISSFDKNKKYAIIEMLFRKEKYFRGKTVLLLTHDFEPVVDLILHHSDKFLPPYTTYLENFNGNLNEKEIVKSDIKTFLEIWNENLCVIQDDLNKIIYLRRLFEIENKKNNGYHLISNILHKRKNPTIPSENDRLMTENEINDGIKEIKERIPNFDYATCVEQVSNEKELINKYYNAKSNYEKLHIFRILFEDNQTVENSTVFMKFINETFHIENDYIFQLNPCKFELVPQFIITECNKYVSDLVQK